MNEGGFYLTTAVSIYIIYVHQVTCASRPLGPKLCERRCLKTAGCWTYIFLIHDLHCDVTGTRKKGKHFFNFNVTREIRKLNPPCDSGLRIILTKRGQLKCEFTRGQLHGDLATNLQRRPYRKERLLFLPYQTPTRRLFFYYPGNKTIKNETLKLKDQYLGMADISASEVILYNRARHLMIFDLQEKHINIIKRRILIIDMATGDMCVYLLVGLGNNTQKLNHVESITTDQQRAWSIKVLPFPVADCSKLEYDAQNSVLYLLCGSNVQRIDLKKGSQAILTDGLSAENIAVDGRNGILYYSFKSTFKSLNITDLSHIKNYFLWFDAYGFGYCEGLFFMSSQSSDGWVYEYDRRLKPICSIQYRSKILIA